MSLQATAQLPQKGSFSRPLVPVKGAKPAMHAPVTFRSKIRSSGALHMTTCTPVIVVVMDEDEDMRTARLSASHYRLRGRGSTAENVPAAHAVVGADSQTKAQSGAQQALRLWSERVV